MTATARPSPGTPEDSARWEHTALRLRLLSGVWHSDARQRLVDQLGAVRTDAIRTPELSSNPFASIARELAVLYDVPPVIRHETDLESAEIVGGLLQRAGWAPRMQTVQEQIVGLREMLVRPHVDDQGRVSIRPVTPDHVVAWASADRPEQPVKLRELRRRSVAGVERWTWDEYDITDPERPAYRVLDGDNPVNDITTEVYEQGFDGQAYPHRYADGVPFIPYVLYHAKIASQLWAPYELHELVDGTLSIAVLRSHYAKCVRDASWAQRWAVGVSVPSDDDGKGRSSVVADPSTVLLFDVDETVQGGAQVGQWDNPTDLASLYDSIQAWARDLAQWAGLSPSDFARISGDPRSGYALSLTSEGRKAAARKYEPAAHRGDVELVGKVTAMHNHATGGSLTEDGYQVEYKALPPSAAEVRERRAHVLDLLERGLMTRVQAYREMHGVTEAEARAALARIAAERAPLV